MKKGIYAPSSATRASPYPSNPSLPSPQNPLLHAFSQSPLLLLVGIQSETIIHTSLSLSHLFFFFFL